MQILDEIQYSNASVVTLNIYQYHSTINPISSHNSLANCSYRELDIKLNGRIHLPDTIRSLKYIMFDIYGRYQ